MNEVLYKYYVYLVVSIMCTLLLVPEIIKFMKKPFTLEGEYKKYENNFYILLVRKLISYGIVSLILLFLISLVLDFPRAITHNYKKTVGTVSGVYASSVHVDGFFYETGKTDLEVGDKVIVYNLPITSFAPSVEKISLQTYNKLGGSNVVGKTEFIVFALVLAITLNVCSRFVLKLKHSKEDRIEACSISNVDKAFLDIASVVFALLLIMCKFA